MENFGNTSSPNTCPTFRLLSGLLITEPPFISEPVPTMVRTQPTGMIRLSGSSIRTKNFSQGSSPHQAEAETAFA